MQVLNNVNEALNKLFEQTNKLEKECEGLGEEIADAEKIANVLLPLSEEIGETIAYLEEHVAEDLWPLPTYYDLLFVK